MPKVIILGGGVAGMSAAHELAERGFQVEVYERHKKYVGGKARSTNVKNTNLQDPALYLPGEHGFRFFPGFYKHIIDTMGRIPYVHKDGTPGFVKDNFVNTDRVRMARNGKKGIETIVNFPTTFEDLHEAIQSFHSDTGLTTAQKKFFAERIWQLMTSCYERRSQEYERLSWWDYLKTDQFNDENYTALCVQGLTRTLVAANARYASTKTGGDIFLQLIFNMTDIGVHTDRILNQPTNDAWLTPWTQYLQKLNVTYVPNTEAVELKMDNGHISGVVINDRATGENKTVTGDYYILAMPVERAAKLINIDILKADPALEGIIKLATSVSWMNGIQFYLNKKVDVVHGHCIYSDSKWALTSISQTQFWKEYDLSKRADGSVKTIFSIDVSDWDEPGSNGVPAKNCDHDAIKNEIWHQLKESLNVDGTTVLTDDMIAYWHIDGDIRTLPDQREENEEPLLVNTINSWDLRPDSYTAIPNLFIASDYVRTFTDLATMEGANEAARRAVNGILNASGSKEKLCEVWNLHEPALLAPFRAHDKKRFDEGLPWELYEPWWMRIILKIASWFKKLFRS